MKVQETVEQQRLIIYGHNYCAQAVMLARVLKQREVDFEWRDIQVNQHYKADVRKLANGNESVPIVVFPDGSALIEPWPNTVLKRLGRHEPGLVERLVARVKSIFAPAED